MVASFHLDQPTSPSNKCRYKTGKCTNARSSKRNGQPHMLCLYHRDKANKIQRKFDRQKRQSVRMKKSSAASPRSASHAVSGAASAFANSMAAAASASTFTGMLGHQEPEIYSDSDSSRFSTDSESSRLSSDSDAGAVASLDLVWQDLQGSSLMMDTLTSPMAATCGSSVGVRFHTSVASGSLSHEELDFLYAAMLD